jgi:hypothetical protein
MMSKTRTNFLQTGHKKPRKQKIAAKKCERNKIVSGHSTRALYSFGVCCSAAAKHVVVFFLLFVVYCLYFL